jgi:hypothetical protein
MIKTDKPLDLVTNTSLSSLGQQQSFSQLEGGTAAFPAQKFVEAWVAVSPTTQQQRRGSSPPQFRDFLFAWALKVLPLR